jgi:hypothetical protein
MQFFKLAFFKLATAFTASASPVRRYETTKRYAILDNDWSTNGFIPYLLALDAGIEILAITSCTYSTPA